MKTQYYKNGYIALISVILISVSLLILVVAVSFEGFFSRFTVLESEQKEMSAYLAESCVNTAVLKITQDVEYDGDETIAVGDSSCEIVAVTDGSPFATDRLIQAQGIYKDAYTNLEVQIDPDDLPVVTYVSWTEVGSF